MKSNIAQHKISCERQLNLIANHSGGDTLVSLSPLNAGMKPCQVAINIADKPFKAFYAPIVPLDGCIDPEKCACVYSVLHFTDPT